jgi:hypothetical protein
MRAFMLQISEAEHESFLAMSPGSMPLASSVQILPEVELVSGVANTREREVSTAQMPFSSHLCHPIVGCHFPRDGMVAGTSARAARFFGSP